MWAMTHKKGYCYKKIHEWYNHRPKKYFLYSTDIANVVFIEERH